VPEENGSRIGLAEVASLLAVAGAFFYTALRVAYGVFYARLDAKPEDVGLGYQQILAQSVGALMLLVLAAILALALAAGVASFLRSQAESIEKIPPSKPRPSPTLRQRITAGALLLGIIGAAVAIDWKGFLGTFLVIGLAMVTLLLYLRYRQIKDQRLARWVRAGFVSAFIALGFVAVLVVLCARASDDADAVRRGQEGTFEFLGIPITSWGAEPGTLKPATTTAPDAALPTGCVLFLGQADGIVVAFDPAGQTLRLPVNQVVVSLDHGERCD
jgi:hypothetical protein